MTSKLSNAGTEIGLGLDSGSTTTKAVVFGNGQILASAITPTLGDIVQAGKTVLGQVKAEHYYRKDNFSRIVTTGSGRTILADICSKKFKKIPVKMVTEITCHAAGVFYLYPKIRLVVDIGGQDSKVIRISEYGAVSSFVMNDKCAAGTGRFFEIMAGALRLELKELVRIALRARRSVEITNTCTVFAESEIISHLAAGRSKSSVLLGLHESIAQRIFSLMRAVGIEKPVAMTGGVANNRAMVREIERRLGDRILVPQKPELMGALGAALLAERVSRQNK